MVRAVDKNLKMCIHDDRTLMFISGCFIFKKFITLIYSMCVCEGGGWVFSTTM